MPEIKDYEGKKKGPQQGHHKGKRRPHHEAHGAHAESDETLPGTHELSEQDADIMDGSEAINTEAQNEGVSMHAQEEMAEKEMISEGAPIDSSEEKIHLEFYGSEVIRQKAPKVMELAETVAEEWVKDGQFEGLPVGNPLAQVAAAKVLRKAKDVEKKLEEKGVFAMAKMGLEYAKAEIQKRKKH